MSHVFCMCNFSSSIKYESSHSCHAGEVSCYYSWPLCLFSPVNTTGFILSCRGLLTCWQSLPFLVVWLLTCWWSLLSLVVWLLTCWWSLLSLVMWLLTCWWSILSLTVRLLTWWRSLILLCGCSPADGHYSLLPCSCSPTDGHYSLIVWPLTCWRSLPFVIGSLVHHLLAQELTCCGCLLTVTPCLFAHWYRNTQFKLYWCLITSTHCLLITGTRKTRSLLSAQLCVVTSPLCFPFIIADKTCLFTAYKYINNSFISVVGTESQT